jgi:diguanylate cyclase (GGDEF)-like protein
VKAIGDSIFDAATGRRIASLERRMEEERRGHEVDSLRREQTIFRLEARERTLERNVTAVIALLAAALGVIVYRRRAERARLAEALSLTDPLTGAKNRRFVEQMVETETAIAVRRHRAAERTGVVPDDADLVCLLLDLDYFKRVNDTFGHAAGDRLLVETARVLDEMSRRSDIVARWGGEEFLVLARCTDRRQAAAHAERMRAAIAAMEVALADGRTLRVTCSIGFAVFPFDPSRPDAVSWEQTLRLADHGVYAAKHGGRDRVVGFVAGELPRDDSAPIPEDETELERWVAAGWIERVEAAELVGA